MGPCRTGVYSTSHKIVRSKSTGLNHRQQNAAPINDVCVGSEYKGLRFRRQMYDPSLTDCITTFRHMTLHHSDELRISHLSGGQLQA